MQLIITSVGVLIRCSGKGLTVGNTKLSAKNAVEVLAVMAGSAEDDITVVGVIGVVLDSSVKTVMKEDTLEDNITSVTVVMEVVALGVTRSVVVTGTEIAIEVGASGVITCVVDTGNEVTMEVGALDGITSVVTAGTAVVMETGARDGGGDVAMETSACDEVPDGTLDVIG